MIETFQKYTRDNYFYLLSMKRKDFDKPHN